MGSRFGFNIRHFLHGHPGDIGDGGGAGQGGGGKSTCT